MKNEQEIYFLGGIKMKNNNRPATQTTHYGNQGNLYLYVYLKLVFLGVFFNNYNRLLKFYYRRMIYWLSPSLHFL